MTRLVWALFLLVSVALAAEAQAPRTGRLAVTVADQTGAIIPNATVTLTGQEQATSGVKPPPGQTSPQGIATFDGLLPGRYQLQAEFEGFETAIIRDLRVRVGDNRQNLTLA